MSVNDARFDSKNLLGKFSQQERTVSPTIETYDSELYRVIKQSLVGLMCKNRDTAIGVYETGR